MCRVERGQDFELQSAQRPPEKTFEYFAFFAIFAVNIFSSIYIGIIHGR